MKKIDGHEWSKLDMCAVCAMVAVVIFLLIGAWLNADWIDRPDPATQERAVIRERLRDIEGFLAINYPGQNGWETYRLHLQAIRALRDDVNTGIDN